MSDQLLRIVSAPGSPYSRKLRAVLRYRRIPHAWLQAGSRGARELPRPRVELLPQLIYPGAKEAAEANMDRWPHAYGLDLLGIASMSQGQNEDALVYFEKSAALSNEIGDQLNGAQTTIYMGQACAAMRLDNEAKRLYLEVYSNAKSNKWIQLLLNVLISFTEIPNVLPYETKLSVALSALAHPAVTPYLRERSEAMRDEAKKNLTEEMIRAVENLANEKSPEQWAQELLK